MYNSTKIKLLFGRLKKQNYIRLKHSKIYYIQDKNHISFISTFLTNNAEFYEEIKKHPNSGDEKTQDTCMLHATDSLINMFKKSMRTN